MVFLHLDERPAIFLKALIPLFAATLALAPAFSSFAFVLSFTLKTLLTCPPIFTPDAAALASSSSEVFLLLSAPAAGGADGSGSSTTVAVT